MRDETTGDVEVSRGIVCNPERLGGKPCVVGRRITAQMVVNYMEDPNPAAMRSLLVEEYDLSHRDIDNALAWHRKGRPSA